MPYMFDTNMVGHLLKQHPFVSRRVVDISMKSLCVSAITAGELLFGLARRPAAMRLNLAVREFLRRVEVIAWDADVAARFGTVRAQMQAQGTTLAPLDLLIATHALCAGAVIVTNDQAFGRVPDLQVEDWTIEAT